VINLAASLLLTRWLGLIGPALGTLAANVTISLWWLPIQLRTVFGVSLRALFRAVAWPLVWGVPYAGALWWVGHVHKPWGWPGLIAEMGVAALAFLVVSGVAILSPTDRALWRLRLVGMAALVRGRAARMSAPPSTVNGNDSAVITPAGLAAQPGGPNHDDDDDASR
jgi:hypothetical protein